MNGTGYYLTYDSGNGIFGYCGESDMPPFYFKGHAIVFASRKEAREALKRCREQHGVNLNHYTARHFAIISTEDALIKNE